MIDFTSVHRSKLLYITVSIVPMILQEQGAMMIKTLLNDCSTVFYLPAVKKRKANINL